MLIILIFLTSFFDNKVTCSLNKLSDLRFSNLLPQGTGLSSGSFAATATGSTILIPLETFGVSSVLLMREVKIAHNGQWRATEATC